MNTISQNYEWIYQNYEWILTKLRVECHSTPSGMSFHKLRVECHSTMRNVTHNSRVDYHKIMSGLE